MKTGNLVRFGALALALASTLPVRAQQAATDWPTKPVKVIVPFAPGGSTDVLTRLVATHAQQTIGANLVVDNKGGAQGTIGATLAKNSPPDGYTFVTVPSTTICVTPAFRKNMPFDANRDFEAVGTIAAVPMVLVAKPAPGIETLADLMTAAKQARPRMSYATAGVGGSQQLYSDQLKKTANVDMENIPFQGEGPGVQAVLAGHVTMTMTSIASVQGLLKAGQLKALAITGTKRSPSFPAVPTFVEQGYPQMRMVGWIGIMAPTGTPHATIQKMNAVLASFANSPANSRVFLDVGMLPAATTPEEMKRMVRDDCREWQEMARSMGVVPE